MENNNYCEFALLKPMKDGTFQPVCVPAQGVEKKIKSLDCHRPCFRRRRLNETLKRHNVNKKDEQEFGNSEAIS